MARDPVYAVVWGLPAEAAWPLLTPGQWVPLCTLDFGVCAERPPLDVRVRRTEDRVAELRALGAGHMVAVTALYWDAQPDRGGFGPSPDERAWPAGAPPSAAASVRWFLDAAGALCQALAAQR